jgi:CRISPR-associated protein Cas2
MQRRLYLVAYDISDPMRLQKARQFLKGFSTGGQKSVYECFLTRGELRHVSSTLRELIDEREDRVHIFSVEARSRTHTLGVALQPADPAYFYVG